MEIITHRRKQIKQPALFTFITVKNNVLLPYKKPAGGIMKKIFSVLLLSTVLILFIGTHKSQALPIRRELKQELMKFLRSHGISPEDYVISKFKDYEIIFIGEAHKIRHDVHLIHKLIPRLYEAGVHNLGIEFGCYEYQEKVDSLITAETYDEDLARWLMFKWGSYWGYQEYLDIYRKAWELNKSLPKKAPKFRVVNLDYRANWYLVKEGSEAKHDRVFYKGERDEHMAKVIIQEFVEKNVKALIFSGQHHAFTHYFEPEYDFKMKRFIGYKKNRMGNIINRKIPKKIFNIVLHYPWQTKKDPKKFCYPVEGVIDKLMMEFGDKRIGFDVKNSPFGDLPDERAFYSIGYKDFCLDQFCDGYIFQSHITDYEGVTLDRKFITKDNFKEAVEYLPNPRLKSRLLSYQQLLSYINSQANVKKAFGEVE